MLKSLFIKNFALIDQVQLDFKSGFTVITGETGSGKSILLDGLSLVLGKRADASQLKNKSEKAILEASFLLKSKQFKSLFEEEDLDFSEETIIRREILPSGKSRLFINDTPCLLNQIKNLSDRLLDMHLQNDIIDFNEANDKLNLVDTYAKNTALVNSYCASYSKWLDTKNTLQKAINQKNNNTSDLDYKTFLLNELSTLNLSSTESIEDLEKDLAEYENLDAIQTALSLVQSTVYESDANALEILENALNSLNKVAGYNEKIASASEQLKTTVIELKDLEGNLHSLTDSLEANPERHAFLVERVNAINALLQKHKVSSVDELLNLQNELSAYIDGFSNSAEQISKLTIELKAQFEALKHTGEELQKARAKVSASLEKNILAELALLGMPKANFKIEYNYTAEPAEFGFYVPEFLISTNPGMPLASLETVVSGGEKSRILLSLKSILSAEHQTLILDEIDTGVSGAIALKMGDLMRKIAQNRQVISVTHLPQVSAKAIHHFKVSKKQHDTYTEVFVEALTEEGRVKEIAELLGSNTSHETALHHAKQLMN